jgi:hypothetical protein
MQMKMTLGFHLTPIKMAIIITQATKNAGKDVGKKEHFHIVGM